MILYINTTDGEKITLALGRAGELVAEKEFKAKYSQSETLLPAIYLLLTKNKIKLSDLRGIVIVNGPGPFTATRIGVTTANALAYGLKIKIAGLRAGEFKSIEEMVAKGWVKLKKVKLKNIVEPVYDREPNITIGKYKYMRN